MKNSKLKYTVGVISICYWCCLFKERVIPRTKLICSRARPNYYQFSIFKITFLFWFQNGVSLIWLRYEIPQGNNRAVKLTTSTENGFRISIAAPARIARLAPCDFRLITACIDGSIHIVHYPTGITHTTRAGFVSILKITMRLVLCDFQLIAAYLDHYHSASL